MRPNGFSSGTNVFGFLEFFGQIFIKNQAVHVHCHICDSDNSNGPFLGTNIYENPNFKPFWPIFHHLHITCSNQHMNPYKLYITLVFK